MSATHWNVEHAKHQYRFERDPKEPLFAFKQRCLVHFAVDTELVFMTTKLEGKDTFFLSKDTAIMDAAAEDELWAYGGTVRVQARADAGIDFIENQHRDVVHVAEGGRQGEDDEEEEIALLGLIQSGAPPGGS